VELMPAECTRKDLKENPINAVAIEVDDANPKIFWCAVSREDKTLVVYKVENTGTKECALQIEPPTTVHTTSKRVGCMCFARVPYKEDSKGMMVLLAGDFTGDALAFPLEKTDQEPRLLLGHTASMLTGIQHQRNVILTSDRDEKIRISSFPQTTIIKGFLLGHEAYVSALAVPKSGTEPICVTCSGDGTVRVWDYQAVQELVQWSADPPIIEDGGEKDKHETNVDADTGKEEKDSTESENGNDKIPSRVAVDAKGEFIALMYDQFKTMDILQLKKENGKHSLSLAQSIECPDQPLNLCFNDDNKLIVLMKDPSYLQIYQQTKDATFESMDLPKEVGALQKFAVENKLQMPGTVFEKDKQGVPTMQKENERRGGANGHDQDKPWNRTERIEIAKQRNKRHKIRRDERKRQGNKKQKCDPDPVAEAATSTAET